LPLLFLDVLESIINDKEGDKIYDIGGDREEKTDSNNGHDDDANDDHGSDELYRSYISNTDFPLPESDKDN